MISHNSSHENNEPMGHKHKCFWPFLLCRAQAGSGTNLHGPGGSSRQEKNHYFPVDLTILCDLLFEQETFPLCPSSVRKTVIMQTDSFLTCRMSPAPRCRRLLNFNPTGHCAHAVLVSGGQSVRRSLCRSNRPGPQDTDRPDVRLDAHVVGIRHPPA